MTSSRVAVAVVAAVGLATLGAACSSGDTAGTVPVPGPVPPADARSGGDITVFDATTAAFSRSPSTLDADSRRAFAVGNSFFHADWVVAPANAEGRDGLGPVFNAHSCSSCHVRDGRAEPPDASGPPGLVIRLSVPGTAEHGEPQPEPNYGEQLQDASIPGVPAEGTFTVTRTEIGGTFADGTPYTLEQPTYRIDGNFGPLADDVMLSPRIAPAIVGMGLLEAVPDEVLLALADPDDADGDGISGRPNMVWDVDAERLVIGRFGWKATQPTIRQQVASAFQGDHGLTTSLSPEQPCEAIQVDCVAAPSGGEPEIGDVTLDRVTFYSRTLAVPARRAVDDRAVLTGGETFAALGCSSCHTPTLRTGDADIPGLSNQDFHPYTDLLLHDMGEGLADGRPEFEASGTEWRTPPLWGIGLVEVVNGHTRFLHDGRARSLEEAILWHGGEAEAAQHAYVSLSADERAALIAFLQSL